jgi:protein-tyrosine phosphatase
MLPATNGPYFPAKEIIPNLWIGSKGDSARASFFKKHNIRLVVNATANLPFKAPADVARYRIPVDDSPRENDTMLRHFPTVVPMIDDVLRHGHGVLVHCHAGMQRSAATVAAYLMWKRGLTADEALEAINSKKHETFWPVATFEPALRAWETTLAAGGR